MLIDNLNKFEFKLKSCLDEEKNSMGNQKCVFTDLFYLAL